MINDIIDSILSRLYECFGDEYKYYTESVEQGFKEPCFFVYSISPKSVQFLSNRYISQNSFTIHYFPKEKDCKKEINNITEQMFEVLEYIELEGNIIRGTNVYTEISEGVLIYFVSYDFFKIKQSVKTPMEDIETKGGIKNG